MRDIDDDASALFATVPEVAFVTDYPGLDDEPFATFVRNGAAFIADSDGVHAGYALVGQVDEDGHVFQVSVRMAQQRKGVGRLLVDQCGEWARRRQFAALTLTTFRDAPWNAPAYIRMGFEIWPVDLLGPQLAAILDHEREIGLFRAPRVAMRRAQSR